MRSGMPNVYILQVLSNSVVLSLYTHSYLKIPIKNFSHYTIKNGINLFRIFQVATRRQNANGTNEYLSCARRSVPDMSKMIKSTTGGSNGSQEAIYPLISKKKGQWYEGKASF